MQDQRKKLQEQSTNFLLSNRTSQSGKTIVVLAGRRRDSKRNSSHQDRNDRTEMNRSSGVRISMGDSGKNEPLRSEYH